MEERLKGLKKAMNTHTFRQVKFTDEHRQKVNQQIEEIDLSGIIFPLLTQSKTGFELTQLLHVRGIKSILNNEGAIYTTLHEEELQGMLESYWSDEGEKHYTLTKKGLKVLQKQQLAKRRENSLKQLFNEVTPNEN
ncbi:helix-turn-helix transcriptional regulator [Ureibacillus chungkukjangi]|uniref:PadR family transcriptional regulator n=1 Tax=Ureibacillus chungkukjangi TaxID=1202712 RepID=A0A318TPW8_9BACL|nr:helix-turn-helix transcriptional regulator [Ureibacillus chungkukjangi]MCM3388803.1 helix-turn-helix transcriptional regulator [Ureibacillus chungkukjangi]PYF06714.1 PadR family transcriptional regulator [Ureibacillus chungkukjangi]